MATNKTVFFLIGILLIVLGGSMLAPYALQVILKEGSHSFISSSFVTIFIGVLFVLANLEKEFKLNLRQTFLFSSLAWVMVATFGSLPFLLSSQDFSLSEAPFLANLAEKENTLSDDLVKAIELAKSGAYKEALRICRKIKPNNIYNAAYFNVVGIVCRRLGLLDEALLNSRRAIQIDKSLVAAKMNIANIELQKGDINQAIKSLELIIAEQPSYHEAKANLALAYRRVGKIERSLRIYKELEFHGSWSLKAKFNYGTTLITNKHSF